MTEFEKMKALLDDLKIPYEESDADYWKDIINIPGKEDVIEDLNKYGAKKLDVKPLLGQEQLVFYESGMCAIVFTRESERFVAFETD